MRDLGWRPLVIALLLVGCGDGDVDPQHGTAHADEHVTEARGPHGGRVLTTGEFTLELAIFERGTPPEFRAWASKGGAPIAPADVSLTVRLERLGGRLDEVSFAPETEFLRGQDVVAEPHSFGVSIAAVHEGRGYDWHYETLEGRTRIAAPVAKALGVATAVAGAARLTEVASVYGRIRANPEGVREVRARFDGVVRGVYATVGSIVEKGDKLLSIESDESLRAYSVAAPIAGVVTQRDANPGEQTHGRLLLTITDTSSVWVDLSVFPGDRDRIRLGSPVSIEPVAGGTAAIGVISTIEPLARQDQSVVARVVLANDDGRLVPGSFVDAHVTVGEHEVALAVERSGLQKFRDFTVVYANEGDEYEVRMLELGREAGDYVEVVSGLDQGTRYVTSNSHLIKADIEKSGATHDH